MEPQPLQTAQQLPDISSATHFTLPTKKIFSQAEVLKFRNSKAAFRICVFLQYICSSVVSKKTNDSSIPISDNANLVISLLNDLIKLVDDVPPAEGPRRFGNTAFRVWVAKAKEV